MPTVRAMSHALPDRSTLIRGGVLGLVTMAIAYGAVSKFGTAGILAPVAVAGLALLLQRPVGSMAALFVLTVVCEGPTFGFVKFTDHLYSQAFKGMTPLDMVVAIALFAAAFGAIGSRRPVRLPRPLVPAAIALLLGMIAGAVTGHANGQTLRAVLLSQNVLVYLLLLPLVVANFDLDRRTVQRMLGWVVALAVFKSLLGMIEVAGHYGTVIEGRSTLTYYEATPNWVIMLALLGICAALATKTRLPRWMLFSSPLLLASLILSYRRSFWIAAVLGIVLVVLLGLSPAGRRVLLPVALLVGVAIWLVGSVSIQSQSPVVKRIVSLTPSKLEQSPEASYRNYERANVLQAISEHPITGLGMKVPWAATATVLPLENEEGRQYVEVAALWFWLKLGIIGLVAYVSFIGGSLLLAWRVWRRSPEPELRVFGLASFAGILGLIPMEFTATFTGVDPRFTVVLCVQVGLLALLASRSRSRSRAPVQPPHDEGRESLAGGVTHPATALG